MVEINVRDAKPGDWATFDYKGGHYAGPLDAVDFPMKPYLEDLAGKPIAFLGIEGVDTFIVVVALRPGCNPITVGVENLHVYSIETDISPLEKRNERKKEREGRL